MARSRPAVADGVSLLERPRLYPWEWGYRWETRFPPVDARFVRITQHEQDPRFPWVIAEAYVYEDLGPGAGADAGEPDVLRRIRDLGLGRVYADRWMVEYRGSTLRPLINA